MKFGNDRKVIIETMNKTEAQAFNGFLLWERARHMIDQQITEDAIKALESVKHKRKREALLKFFQTAIERHNDDLKDIDELRKLVIERFRLNGTESSG